MTAVAGGGAWTTAATWSPAQTPTAADDCIIASTSGAVTIGTGALCRSWTVQSGAGTTTHTAGVTLAIGDGTPGAGNVALAFPASGWTYTLGDALTSALNFVSTSATVQTVNFANRVTGNVTHNASSNGSWQYTGGHSIGTTATWTLTKGTVNLNGQTVSWGLFGSSNTNVRALSLGAAVITITGTAACWQFSNTTNMTFNAGTSTITQTGIGSVSFLGGSLPYNNVSFPNSDGGTWSVSGSHTFANLTFGASANKTSALSLNGNNIITGTLSLLGNTAANRIIVRSNVIGTPRTLTAAVVVAQHADFRDIAGAGAANWNLAAITGNSGDCGGNSGITFTSPATQTSTGTTGFTWSTHGWTSRVPLPQDDVVISNAFVAGQTVTLDMPRAGKSLSFVGATGTPDLAVAILTDIYGSVTKIPGMTQSGTLSIIFASRSPATLTSAGVPWTTPLLIDVFGTTLTLLDALTSTAAITHRNGTLIDNGFSTTFTAITSNNGLARTLTRTGAMTLTGTGAVLTYTSAGLTHTGTGSSLTVSDTTQGTSKTLAGGGISTFGALILSGKNIILTGANTFASLALNNLGDTTGITLPASTVTTVTGAITSTASLGNVGKLISSSPGVAATLSKASGRVEVDYLSIQDSTASGGALFFAGSHSTNVSGNTGWNFIDGTVLVAPAALALALTTVNPGVVLGSLTLSPTALALALTTVNPSVGLGSLTLSPAALALALTTVNPGVVLGSLTLSPTALALALTTAGPHVVRGLTVAKGRRVDMARANMRVDMRRNG